MYIFKTVQDLQQHLNQQRNEGKKIGFVPTMGALHLGHLTLVKTALPQNNLVVASIFVNPTQFGDPEDLEKYPRPIESDIEKLEALGCHALFLPSFEEVYPEDLQRPHFDLGDLDKGMEGAHRPGHFAGVVQVVHRLLDIVQPDSLYMGQKDYQQAAIIGWMINSHELPVELVVSPIKREADGLAMSSRNVRLDPAIRTRATILYETLSAVKEKLLTHSVLDLQKWALATLQQKDFRPEYFDIVDGETLQPLQTITEKSFVVACTAVWAGEVRLIDNMILQKRP